nr:hypothetical protein CPGR_05144 [Mycolicibacterium malmesburyense]
MNDSSRSRSEGRIGLTTMPANVAAWYTTAASYQFGSMNDTTLPGGMRDINACASATAWS